MDGITLPSVDHQLLSGIELSMPLQFSGDFLELAVLFSLSQSSQQSSVHAGSPDSR